MWYTMVRGHSYAAAVASTRSDLFGVDTKAAEMNAAGKMPGEGSVA